MKFKYTDEYYRNSSYSGEKVEDAKKRIGKKRLDHSRRKSIIKSNNK